MTLLRHIPNRRLLARIGLTSSVAMVPLLALISLLTSGTIAAVLMDSLFSRDTLCRGLDIELRGGKRKRTGNDQQPPTSSEDHYFKDLFRGVSKGSSFYFPVCTPDFRFANAKQLLRFYIPKTCSSDFCSFRDFSPAGRLRCRFCECDKDWQVSCNSWFKWI